MDKKIVILICMIMVIVAIIALSTMLLLRLNTQKENLNNEKDNLIALLTEKVMEIDNRDQFFHITSHIKKYFDYKKQNNVEAVQAISAKERMDYDNFQSKEMYLLNKINNYTVYVCGTATKENMQTDSYIVVNLDYTNYTFSISSSSKEEYENAKDNIVQDKYKENVVIQSNEYNAISLEEIANDFQVLKIYFDDYKYKALNNPELAFQMLDMTYKKEKFNNNVERFKEYIQKNKDILQDANIVKHTVTKENEYTKYAFIDNFNNYYELTETGIYEYTITLDNYTVQTKEQADKYNQLTDEQKALSNIDKVMKLIDQKDYDTVYRYLNEDFRNKNFPTIQAFTKYMKENFFEDNIVGKIGTRAEGNIFILVVPYKESLSKAAEEREKTFIMKLKEGTSFELSFDV